jgi:hypothetical protein
MPEPTVIQPVPNRDQIGAIVNLCTEGLLNILMGESPEDRKREMNENHDRMLKIIDAHPVADAKPYQSPREQIMQETQESNNHIHSAMTELEKAQKLAKCSVCKKQIGETINIVHSKTQEILDASEKVLAMQRLKEIGELPTDATWEDLNKIQKRQVETIVEKFRPVQPIDYMDGGELQNEAKRKISKPRKPQKPKSKSRR